MDKTKEGLYWLDFLVNQDVLLLSVSGISNDEISNHVRVSITEIRSILDYYLHFYGFVTTLGFSPWRLYHKDKDYLLTFGEEYVTICRRFEELRKEHEQWLQSI